MKKFILICGFIMLITGCTTLKVSAKKEHFLIRGLNYNKNGEYTKAINEYQKYYKQDNQNIYLLLEMGLTYGKLKQYKKSEKYYLEALKIDPTNQIVLSNLSILYYKMNDLKKSKYYLLKVSPDNMNDDLYILSAYIDYSNGDYTKAYNNFNKIEHIKIKDDRFMEIYVKVLQKTNRRNEIYPFIYKIYKENSDNYEVVISYSRFLVNIYKDKNGAIKVLKTYLAKVNNGPVIIELAKLYYQMGKINEAQLYLNLLPDNYNYNVEVLKLKQNIAIKKHNPKAAEIYQQKLLKVGEKKR